MGKRFRELTQTATDADFVEGNYFGVDTPSVTKKVPANLVAKQSSVAALQTKTDNISASIATEFVPNTTTTVAGILYMYNGSLYIAKEDGYQGPWNANKFVSIDLGYIIRTSGVVERLNGGVVLEQGSYAYGIKSDSSTRVRFNVPLMPPFSISVKSGYKIQASHKLTNNDVFVESTVVGAATYAKTIDDGYKYTVTIAKSDNTQDILPTEDIIDSVYYPAIGNIADAKINDLIFAPFDASKNYTAGEVCSKDGGLYKFIQAKAAGAWNSSVVNKTNLSEFLEEQGIIERLNGVVVLEQGSYRFGQKQDNTNRVRLNRYLIPPFEIKLNDGYKVLSAHKMDNKGVFVESVSINEQSYSVSTTNGYKYALIISKTDSTQPILPTENIINSFVYINFAELATSSKAIQKEHNSGVYERLNGGLTLELGNYSRGVKADNSARARYNLPLLPPFSIETNSGYWIHTISKIDKDDNYIDFVNVGDSTYAKTGNDGYKYLVTFKRTDNSDISSVEGIVKKLDYTPICNLAENLVDYNKLSHAVKIFERVGVIGDSYAAGYIKNDEQERVIATNYSWPCFMQGRTARTWTNFAKSGSTCKSWVNRVENFSNLDLMEREGQKCQAYVIGLQINDVNPTNPNSTPTAGTISDIGTDNDTYCAYLYKLIQAVVAINSDAKIFVCTCPKNSDAEGSHNDIVRQVVAYCKTTLSQNVYCLDLVANQLYFTQSSVFTADAINGHYTAIGYEYMAEVIDILLTELINSNLSDFQNVCRIPFDAVT